MARRRTRYVSAHRGHWPRRVLRRRSPVTALIIGILLIGAYTALRDADQPNVSRPHRSAPSPSSTDGANKDRSDGRVTNELPSETSSDEQNESDGRTDEHTLRDGTIVGYMGGKVRLRQASGDIVHVPIGSLPASERESVFKHFDIQLFEGVVVAVNDGDTITVRDANQDTYRVRLKGIDAPELGQAFGSAARKNLNNKVYRQRVTVEWTERDRYDRILGHILVDERHINMELLEDGFAWHFQWPEADELLAAAESRARERDIGLWSDRNPVPPWEYRKQHPR